MSTVQGVVSSAATDRPSLLSLDVWVMSNPSSAFRWIAHRPSPRGAWVTIRRPLLLAWVLGCLISLGATGTLTVRLVGSATVYWAFVPLVETLSLAIVLRGRHQPRRFATFVDAFFAGHGPWTLFLIAIAATLAFLPPERAWALLHTVGIWGLPFILGWSARIDFCFFRQVLNASRSRALRDVIAFRLIAWTLIFWLFAVPATTPWGVVQEIADTAEELSRE